MSAGPGKLQRRILHILREHKSFIPQRKVLWEIAREIDKIEITGELSNGELRSGIPTGSVKRSLEESFRIAVKSLGENGSIEIKKAKFINLDEAFDYFPYHTSNLEISCLRQKLLPTIIEYIKEEKPRRFGSSEIEEKQIAEILNTEKYKEAGRQWNAIQKEIISILHRGDTDIVDQWIQCLVRGRYLFVDEKIAYSRSFTLIYRNLEKQENKTTAELNALISLKNLIRFVFDKTDWKIGRLKSVLYGMGKFEKHQKDTLDDEVKYDLLKKHEALITALPGHVEPEKPKGRGMAWGHVGKERRYSEYLNKLLTKQILKRHRLIKAS